jgi:hypothetical protein
MVACFLLAARLTNHPSETRWYLGSHESGGGAEAGHFDGAVGFLQLTFDMYKGVADVTRRVAIELKQSSI